MRFCVRRDARAVAAIWRRKSRRGSLAEQVSGVVGEGDPLLLCCEKDMGFLLENEIAGVVTKAIVGGA